MKKDWTPWFLLPGIVLTLSSVTLLAPRQTVQAAVPVPAAKPPAAPPQPAVYDDGDGGTELLEPWGDPQYSREARRQMAGMACGFLVLGFFQVRRRTRKKSRCEVVPMPTESDFLKWDSRKAA
jgi:hypothetical protein